MRIGVALLVVMVNCTPVLAFDTSKLPQTCKDAIAQIQSEKPRMGQLGSILTKTQKANDTANFCPAAKEMLSLIINENGKIDTCLGDVAADKTLANSTVDEMTQLKAWYRIMIDAAKKPESDRMKCGLADL